MPECKRLCSLVLAIALMSVAKLAAATMAVGHIQPDATGDERDAYFLDMLELALALTEEDYGAYRLVEAPLQMNQSRAIREMLTGRHLDVIWSMTDVEREARMHPIRIPLYKGLLGVRVPLVRADDVELLASVSTLAELQAYRPGQGHDWPDTDILRANGIPVETSASYEGLFRMLSQGRMDYLPRSVVEIWAEREMYDQFELLPGQGPLIAYPAPIYFFVAPDNRILAERIEVGLERAIDTGAFQTLFESHPANRVAIDQFLSSERPIIWLDNPSLPKKTPLDEQALWFDPVFRYRHMLQWRFDPGEVE